MDKQFLTIDEVVQEFGVDPAQIQALVAAGELKALADLGTYRYRREAIVTLIELGRLAPLPLGGDSSFDLGIGESLDSTGTMVVPRDSSGAPDSGLLHRASEFVDSSIPSESEQTDDEPIEVLFEDDSAEMLELAGESSLNLLPEDSAEVLEVVSPSTISRNPEAYFELTEESAATPPAEQIADDLAEPVAELPAPPAIDEPLVTSSEESGMTPVVLDEEIAAVDEAPPVGGSDIMPVALAESAADPIDWLIEPVGAVVPVSEADQATPVSEAPVAEIVEESIEVEPLDAAELAVESFEDLANSVEEPQAVEAQSLAFDDEPVLMDEEPILIDDVEHVEELAETVEPVAKIEVAAAAEAESEEVVLIAPGPAEPAEQIESEVVAAQTPAAEPFAETAESADSSDDLLDLPPQEFSPAEALFRPQAETEIPAFVPDESEEALLDELDFVEEAEEAGQVVVDPLAQTLPEAENFGWEADAEFEDSSPLAATVEDSIILLDSSDMLPEEELDSTLNLSESIEPIELLSDSLSDVVLVEPASAISKGPVDFSTPAATGDSMSDSLSDVVMVETVTPEASVDALPVAEVSANRQDSKDEIVLVAPVDAAAFTPPVVRTDSQSDVVLVGHSGVNLTGTGAAIDDDDEVELLIPSSSITPKSLSFIAATSALSGITAAAPIPSDSDIQLVADSSSGLHAVDELAATDYEVQLIDASQAVVPKDSTILRVDELSGLQTVTPASPDAVEMIPADIPSASSSSASQLLRPLSGIITQTEFAQLSGISEKGPLSGIGEKAPLSGLHLPRVFDTGILKAPGSGILKDPGSGLGLGSGMGLGNRNRDDESGIELVTEDESGIRFTAESQITTRSGIDEQSGISLVEADPDAISGFGAARSGINLSDSTSSSGLLSNIGSRVEAGSHDDSGSIHDDVQVLGRSSSVILGPGESGISLEVMDSGITLQPADSGISLEAIDSGMTLEILNSSSGVATGKSSAPGAGSSGFDATQEMESYDDGQHSDLVEVDEFIDADEESEDHQATTTLVLDDEEADGAAPTMIKRGRGGKQPALTTAFDVDDEDEGTSELELDDELAEVGDDDEDAELESDFDDADADADEELVEAEDEDFTAEAGEMAGQSLVGRKSQMATEPSWGMVANAIVACAAVSMLTVAWLAWEGVATMWDGHEPSGPAAMLISTLAGMI